MSFRAVLFRGSGLSEACREGQNLFKDETQVSINANQPAGRSPWADTDRGAMEISSTGRSAC